MNLEFEETSPGRRLVAKPFTEPTTSTFLILRKRFAKIVGELTYLFNKLHEPARFEEVEALDRDIRQYIQDLPPHFRYDHPDTSLDELPQYSYVPVQRFYLATEIFYILITLHRPWLLRKLKSNKYALSRKASFEAAKMDFRIRQAFRAKHPGVTNSYVGGQYREFNAAMIAGIYAILLPRGEDADEMRQSLATFIKQRPLEKVEDMASRREIAIIQTLHRRANQVLDPSAVNTNDAALLLGLREGDAARHVQEDRHGQVKQELFSAGTPLPESQQTFSRHVNYPPLMPASAQLGSGTVRPDALSKLATTASFQPLSLHNHRPNWQSPSSTSAVTMQSPASTGSAEDEHPQRLLDKWLSVHSSLAVGAMNDSDYGLMDPPGGLVPPPFGNPVTTQNLQAATTLSPGINIRGWQGMLNHGGGGGGGGSVQPGQDPLLADQGMAPSSYQQPQGDTFHGIADRMAVNKGGYGDSTNPSGIQGDTMGMDGSYGEEFSDLQAGLALDDSYWNNLIDGQFGK